MRKTGYLPKEFDSASEKVMAAEVSLLRGVGNSLQNHVRACYVRSFYRLLKEPMICGIDLTNINCLKVMIAILSIEFFDFLDPNFRNMIVTIYCSGTAVCQLFFSIIEY